MRQLRNQDDYWKPCRPGTILNVSDSKFVQQRRRFIIRTVMGSVLGVLGVCSAGFLALHRRPHHLENTDALSSDPNFNQVVSTSSSKPAPIELTCQEIQNRLDDYLVTIKVNCEERTPEHHKLVADFQQHLAICQSCAIRVLDAVSSA